MTTLTSIHGRLLGVTADGDLYSHGRLIVPGPGNPFQRIRMADDFLGDVIADEWTVNAGSGGSATVAISAGIGGLLLFTSDDSAGTVGADGAQLVGSLNWQASNGGLTFETRLRNNSALTTRSLFCGFTDSTSLEDAFDSSGTADGITSTASDAVGFLFDSRMTTKEWWAVGVAANTDAAHVSTGVAPVADAFDRLRVEIDAAGTALFYVNGVRKARLTGCVTPGTDLCPTISIYPTTTAVATCTADYVLVEMDR